MSYGGISHAITANESAPEPQAQVKELTWTPTRNIVLQIYYYYYTNEYHNYCNKSNQQIGR